MHRLEIPPILNSVGKTHCVIEASAGTGKTYTLEHLVVQLLLEGIPLEQILVVTFTKKATLELIERVRAKLQEVVAFAGPSCRSEKAHWELDSERRERVRKALTRFDQATISTIHGFCQQVLQEAAFEGGRLLKQKVVAKDELFDRAFTSLLRTTFTQELGGMLQVALAQSNGLEALKRLLKNALPESENLDLPATADLREILGAFPADLAQRLLEKDPELCEPLEGKRGGVPLGIRRLLEALLRKREDALAGNPVDFWRIKPLDPGDFDIWREKARETPLEGEGARLYQAVAGLLNVDELLVATFLPPLREEMERLKAEEGLFDFDDMIRLVAEALSGRQGDALVQRLRERFRVAIIDEFQDTDARQWEIFRRIFLDSHAGHRLIVVGDPKQAIYGFRGGDLPTYTQAIKDIGGSPLQLKENWRSTDQLIQAYKRILEPGQGFFQGENADYYQMPVTCAKSELRLEDASRALLPAIRVVPVEAGDAATTRAKAAEGLARTLGDTLQQARFCNPKRPEAALKPEDVYVLVHKGSEGQQMAKVLQAEGIPAAIYREDGLFDGPEAQACRDLFLALASPQDPARRNKALLGPFFGLSFREAEQAKELPEDHPILARLRAWQGLARGGSYGKLFNQLTGESGLTRRLLFLEEGQRRLTNLLHILELLLHQALKTHPTPEDLAHQVQRWIDGQERPAVEESETQRLERQKGAVQILTMHKSKGLQAPVVVLCGGTAEMGKKSDLHRYHRKDRTRCERRVWVGPTKFAPQEVQDAIDEEKKREDERLAYVALTRAEAQLILPHYVQGEKAPGCNSNFDSDSHPKGGPYRPINLRLRELVGTSEHPRDMPGFQRVEPQERAEPLPVASWSPILQESPVPTPDFRALATQARGCGIFSYTGMQRVLEPDQEFTQTQLSSWPGTETQQWGQGGGKKLGIQVHALLQEVDFASFGETDFETWLAQPAIQALAERHLSPQWRQETLSWVHQALARPIGLPDGQQLILSQAEEHLRELDFLSPYLQERDYLTGSIDLLFRHGQQTYVLDWKTNHLLDYGPEALATSVQEHYELQLRIYTLTAVAFLGIATREDYERDFGGVIYVYLRGLPEGGGVWSRRPAWEELAQWEKELAEAHQKLLRGEAHV